MDTLRNLQEIYNSVANKFNQYRGEDFVLPQVFKDQVKEINSNVISYNKYSAVIETRGNQNGVLNIYLPNQWFYIASYFTDFYRELLKYKRCALKVASKERLKDLNGAILTDSEQNAVKELDIDEQSQEYLIKFITDYSWWYGAKTIDRGDFFVSPILNSAKLVNASQSFVADLCAFLADKEDLVKVIMSGYTPSETLIKKELVRQKAAATFMKKAMQLTLKKDLDLNRLAALNKYEKTSKQLKINGFFLGRNKNQPPTRIDDIYEDVSWMYDSVNYVLYLEWTPDMMEKRFFPVYNEAYNGMLKMEKDSNGEYVLYEYVVSLSGNTFEKGPLQQIFYGAPGTGKSHEIKKRTKGQSVIRTTFHPDSDYSTFVGAYKPTMDKENCYGLNGSTTVQMTDPSSKKPIQKHTIEYRFVKQAFLKAYLGAWKKYVEWSSAAATTITTGMHKTPNENQLQDNSNQQKETSKTPATQIDFAPQFLIIEEINRGNCAQIFGDLFQLLDRQNNGFSEYPIEADTDLQKEIKNAFKNEEEYKLAGDINVDRVVEDYVSNYENGTLSKDIQEGRILLLPPNLYIWATMNTSDQSLFPIDSAFKRRWEWKYIKITKGKDKDGKDLDWKLKFDYKDKDGKDINKEYGWWDFIQKINTIIASMTSSADKQLGYFFCKAGNDGIISEETFVSKVLFYLWNDVFKDYGFEDASLFQYEEVTDGKTEKKDLAFPNFYNEDGDKVDTERVADFVQKVMSCSKDKEDKK